MKLVGQNLDMNNRPQINLADPTNPQDSATKNYVDSAVRGLSWKVAVRAATTGNITLTGVQTVDGVSLVAGNRVLVKNQTTASANGVYVVASGAWTRSEDADSPDEIDGLTVTVLEGTTQAAFVYTLASSVTGTIVVGTTNLNFTQVGGAGQTYTGSNSVTITSGVIAAKVKASGGVLIDTNGLYVDTTLFTRSYKASIGNGTLTSIPVTHNFGTRDVQVYVYDSTTFEQVLVDVIHTDANTVTISFASAPASNAYRVIVIG